MNPVKELLEENQELRGVICRLLFLAAVHSMLTIILIWWLFEALALLRIRSLM